MKHPFLRRYTDLPSLVYLLSNRKLTLLDPSTWPDENDSHFIQTYKRKRHLTSVLALCFTQASETFHHWHIYASGPAGVCIQFRREELLTAIGNSTRVLAGSVRYRTLDYLRDKTLKTKNLPFLKRIAFKDEQEFRIIYTSSKESVPEKEVDIPLACIERVTLSPTIPVRKANSFKKLLKLIPGCDRLRVYRSTLLNNREWQSFGESAV